MTSQWLEGNMQIYEQVLVLTCKECLHQAKIQKACIHGPLTLLYCQYI